MISDKMCLATSLDFAKHYGLNESEVLEKFPNIRSDILKASILLCNYLLIDPLDFDFNASLNRSLKDALTLATILQVEYYNSDEFAQKDFKSYKIGDFSYSKDNATSSLNDISSVVKNMLKNMNLVNSHNRKVVSKY
ncbi:MAG: DUF3199 family protein [Lachnospirales bacterium]